MYTRITVWTLAVLFILTTLTTPAWARYREAQAQIPDAEDEDGLEVEIAPMEVAVLDDSYLESWGVVSASQYEITMLWITTSGCEFELRFDPANEVEVLGGEDEVCDFLEWAEVATTYVEADHVINVWDSPVWLGMLEYAAAHSGEAEADLTDDPFDPEDHVDVHDASDCQLAWAGTAFAALGCGASAVIALGATGATFGAFSPLLGLTIGACGGTAVFAMMAQNTCSEDFEDILGRPLDDLWAVEPYVDAGVLEDLAQPEDLAAAQGVILNQTLDLSDPIDVETILATYEDVYSDLVHAHAGFHR